MKKSNKVLLYGLLASILLILLCLYAHQDEFMHYKEDKGLASDNMEKIIKKTTPNIENVEKDKIVEELPLKRESKIVESKEVPKNHATLIQSVDKKIGEISKENKTQEDNTSSNIVKRTIFKNKEEVKLKEHSQVEPPKQKILKVDKNLPMEDNKPLIDNEKPKKEKKQVEEKSISKESRKVTSSKSLAAIQEDIAKITNRNISFYKSKSQLTEKSKSTLNKVIKVLKSVPNAKIVVKGYTDASGKEQTNLWISQERAKSVKRYLGKHGIPLKNITAKGFGESELLYGDKPYSKLNRRVEIEIKRK